MNPTRSLYVETYIKDENSEWLVFLHGFGGSVKMWKKQLSFFRSKYNLLLLDLPGHGNSRTGIAQMDIHHFEDVADMIVTDLRRRGIEKACFMCASVGTLVFASIQEKYPEVVSGAILCGAVAGVSRALKHTLAVLDRIKRAFPYMLLLRIFAHLLLPLKQHAKSRSFFIESGKLLGRKEFLAWFSLCIHELDVLKDLDADMNNVLFISGTEDFTFLRGVKRTFGTVNGVRLQLLQHCGHVCSLQFPREFNDLSLEFLEQTLPTQNLISA